MELHYIPIAAYGHNKLSNIIRNDQRKTSYKSKDILADKINDAANLALKGLVALSEENQVCGFIMYKGNKNKPTVTDAFTCEQFIGKGFFEKILSHMKENGFSRPKIEVDDNAEKMEQFISKYGIDLVW